jgi:hypothetical protein
MPVGLLEGKYKLKKLFTPNKNSYDNSKKVVDDNQYLLDLIHESFNKHKVRCLFLFGSALGLYRDKKAIPYDNDVDVGVYDTDVPYLRNVVSELEQHNCYIEQVHFNRLKMQYGNTKLHFDIWLMVPIRWSNLHYKIFGLRWFNSYTYYREDFFNWEKATVVQINQRKYYLPNLIEDYFVKLYGSDWKTPIKNRECIERGIGSRILLWAFVDHTVPAKFSGTGGLTTWKPWASKFLLRFFPNSKLCNEYKHPVLAKKQVKLK